MTIRLRNRAPKILSSPQNRSELLSLLSEACELEHGLACSYLYTAFTLKQDEREGGVTWQQLQLIRKWASQILFVASEEMLHLAQAWNLLASIGGTPYYQRPNFPQGAKYYPIEANLILERFSARAIQRFIFYERPQNLPATVAELQSTANEQYSSVGELYSFIRRGFESLPERDLFIGYSDRQVRADLIHFPDIIPVVDRESAFAAIDMIVEQGEGNPRDHLNSHYGTFVQILEEFRNETSICNEKGTEFRPARMAATNPVSRMRSDYGYDPDLPITLITDSYTKKVSELFDELYILMLRVLQYIFNNSVADRARLGLLARTAIEIMPVVLKPLGEALTVLPSGASGEETAGPSFAMSRHVPLPSDFEIATRVVEERMKELADVADDLASASIAPKSLLSAATNLRLLL
jgi:hypothetical protein